MRKLILVIAILLMASPVSAANRFFVNGGVDNNWGTTGNWSTTSGGAGGSSVPTSADDVFLDGNSPNVTLNTSARTAKSLTCTGYTNTITFSQTLTVSGNVTLVAAMSLAGSSALIVNALSTLTSNGLAVTVPLTLAGNVTHTLADNWNVDALLTIGQSTTQTINGNTINVGAGFTVSGGTVIGTTNFIFDGTGTWSQASAGVDFRPTGTVTINTAGTLTLSGTVSIGGSLTYTAGTVTTTSSRLRICNIATTLAISGITLNDFAVGDATAFFNSTLTLSSDVNVSGTFYFSASTAGTINGNHINLSGTLDGSNNSSVRVTGTTEIVLNGTGTASWNGHLQLSLTINTAGTVTLSGSLSFNGATLKYTAGTVVWSSATILVQTFSGATTTTTFDLNGLVVGANLSLIRTGATAITLALASDMEMDDTTTIVFDGSAAQPVTLKSASAGVQKKFTVQAGASIDLGHPTVTDIDSSSGAVLHAFKGTYSNTTNWSQLTPFDAPLSSGGASEHAFVF